MQCGIVVRTQSTVSEISCYNSILVVIGSCSILSSHCIFYKYCKDSYLITLFVSLKMIYLLFVATVCCMLGYTLSQCDDIKS